MEVVYFNQTLPSSSYQYIPTGEGIKSWSHYLVSNHRPQQSNYLKPISHWAATVGDKNANAIRKVVSKMSQGFSIPSHELQGLAFLSHEFWTCSKNSCDKISLKIVSKSSRVSRIRRQSVSNHSQCSFRESESARNARQLCEQLATYETKMRLIRDKKVINWDWIENKKRHTCETANK